MSFFKVDRNKCKKDNICIRVCVAGIILADEATGYPSVDDKRSARCIACGHCIAYCPHSACSVATLPETGVSAADPSLNITYAHAAHFIRTRRSVRLYRREGLENSTLEELLYLAGYAPTAENAQPVSWLIINGREKLNVIGNKCAELAKKASLGGDRYRRLMQTALASAYYKGNDVFLRGAPCIIIALVPKDYEWPEDGAIAVTYLEMAAHARGLGSCWAGYFIKCARHSEELRKISGINDNMHICGALLIGKPLLRGIKRIPPRKKQNITFI